jgi:dTDP-4-amino-4,6-dideoxygalactose transaminase
MGEILDIADKFNIPVIEDAAHAFPVVENNKYAGTFGNAGVFSFYATKTITTGEGGMVVTNDDTMAAHIKMMRLHGIDRDIWDRYKKVNKNWYYEVILPGFKYNLTDIASAIGIEQLKKVEIFTQRRKTIIEKYDNAFKNYDFITLPPHSESHCWHLYIIRINNKKLKIDRDEFIQKLAQKGIGTSVHFIPLHIMPYYKKKYALKENDFPQTMKKYLSSLSLPLYPDLDNEKIEYIIKSVIEIGLNNYK